MTIIEINNVSLIGFIPIKASQTKFESNCALFNKIIDSKKLKIFNSKNKAKHKNS